MSQQLDRTEAQRVVLVLPTCSGDQIDGGRVGIAAEA